MDWLHPQVLFFALPALAWLFWCDARSTHPMGSSRRRLLLVVRSLLVLLALLALASPARLLMSRGQSVLFLLDHSRSQGSEGLRSVYDIAGQLREALAGDAETGFVAFGEEGRVLLAPGARGPLPEPAQALALMEEIGSSSN